MKLKAVINHDKVSLGQSLTLTYIITILRLKQGSYAAAATALFAESLAAAAFLL
jgi:hypothetical protein